MSERLIRLRDRAHNQIMSIKKFADMITDATDLDDITKRLEALEAKYNDFNELEVQLFDDTTYQPITDVVDDLYYQTYGLLNKANRDRRKPSTTPDLNATLGQFIDQQKTFYEGVNMSQHVRLPKLNIEPFSGDYNYWASFYDLFTTTVHDNQNISGVHKLQMLKGLLSGDAASLIRHIPVTETNYIEAWEKLCNRYNKKNPIVTSLISTFFDQKGCAQANATELRQLTETSDEIIRGLRALGPNAETRDPWIIYVLINKLDSETKQLWANESVGEDFPTFSNLLKFLNKRCDALEICGATNKICKPKSSTKSFFVSNKDTQTKCIICSQAHLLFRCPVFKNQSVETRLKQAMNLNLCRNCLKQGHASEKCFSKFSCLICKKRHHSLLHSAQSDSTLNCNQSVTSHHISYNENPVATSQSPSTPTQQSSTTIATNINQTNTVLHTLFASPTTVLPTAIVYAKTRTGKLQSFRALLDSGSQTSFVTESGAQCLGLKRTQASISVYGLASSSAGQTNGTINMTIQSRLDSNYQRNITAHIIGNITNLLPTKPLRLHNRINEIELADPQFFMPSKIDILLGADVFFEVLTSEQRRINGYPVLQSSKLGWLIAGNYNNSGLSVINLHCSAEAVIQTNNDDIHKLSPKLCDIERHKSSVSTNICEDDNHPTNNCHERVIVKLPVDNSITLSVNTYEAAHHRLLAMYTKFAKIPEFVDVYNSLIDEYHVFGHMIRSQFNEVPNLDCLSHYTVVNSINSKNKLRIVLDTSWKTWSPASILDILKIGPKSKPESTDQHNKFVEVHSKDVNIEMVLSKIASWFKRRKQTNSILSAESIDAKIVMLPKTQQVTFISKLKFSINKTSIHPKHYIESLDPFIDKNLLSYVTSPPVILIKDHVVCGKNIDDIHVILVIINTSDSFTLSIVSNHYWIVGTPNMIEQGIKCCHQCTRYRISKLPPKLIYIPATGCTRCRSLSKLLLHYTGPLQLKNSKRRNSAVKISSGAVFVYLPIKAGNYEVVSNHDTDCATSKRFIARRDIPGQLWCNNGPKSIGANRQLQQLQNQIKNLIFNSLMFVFVLQTTFTFYFNHPHAHYGRFWEKRWHCHYHTTLHERGYWKSTHPQFDIDDLVAIQGYNLYSYRRPHSRIPANHPAFVCLQRVVTSINHRKIIVQ